MQGAETVLSVIRDLLYHPKMITGEPVTGKLVRRVRERVDGKGPEPRVPRLRPISLGRAAWGKRPGEIQETRPMPTLTDNDHETRIEERPGWSQKLLAQCAAGGAHRVGGGQRDRAGTPPGSWTSPRAARCGCWAWLMAALGLCWPTGWPAVRIGGPVRHRYAGPVSGLLDRVG
jgi:hypothetical protein